jgi:hypothetical protein
VKIRCGEVVNNKIVGGSRPSHYSSINYFQLQLTCASLPSHTKIVILLSPSRFSFWDNLHMFIWILPIPQYYYGYCICVLLSCPSNPLSCTCISAQSFVVVACVIIMTQSPSPIIFWDNLHARVRVVHQFNASFCVPALFCRTTTCFVSFFETAYMCIIIFAHLKSKTTRISPQLFFPQ